MSALFERVAGPFSAAGGGVVWDGTAMLFSVVLEGRVLRFDPGDGGLNEVRRFTNRTNGLAIGPHGRLFGGNTYVYPKDKH